MPKKRSRLDIITDMLASIQEKGGEIKPTHLMYKSNLSHVQMTSYLEDLLQKEAVLRISRNNRDYLIITEKGELLLRKLKEMQEFSRTFGI